MWDNQKENPYVNQPSPWMGRLFCQSETTLQRRIFWSELHSNKSIRRDQSGSKNSCIPDSTHQVQPTCQRPGYSSAGSMPGKQFLKSGRGRFSREPLLPPCREKLMHPNVFLFQMRRHLPKMMNCSIISAREELQIILRKPVLNSQFKTPIYP